MVVRMVRTRPGGCALDDLRFGIAHCLFNFSSGSVRFMDSSSPRTDVTALLRRWSDGDQRALDRLLPLVYDELRGVAHRRLQGERTGHTLQTADLVHEAYARIADADLRLEDRAHFFALAARTMRRILVDYARTRMAEKRGGGARPVPLDQLAVEIRDDRTGVANAEILELHEALERLEAQDARKAQVIEAHIFGGLTYQETAEALGISPASVDRDLRLAKAWLARELGTR
ncbi:MAG: ECF-type sigma factor [Gemmatimonadota bacterium]